MPAVPSLPAEPAWGGLCRESHGSPVLGETARLSPVNAASWGPRHGDCFATCRGQRSPAPRPCQGVGSIWCKEPIGSAHE